MHTAYNECESVISCIESLRDSLGELSNGKTVMPKKWNDNVDSIIEKLKELKY